MRLNVVSWNIKHLRWEKVTNYLQDILDQSESGHIMFFYENKQCNHMGREFVDKFEKGLAKSTATGSQRLEWGGYKYQVGTNEYVWLVFSKSCLTGPKSKHGMGKGFKLEVFAQHPYDSFLRQVGMTALQSSTNETILSRFSVGQKDFRIPAVFNFVLTKPDGTQTPIRIAAWHAPGPATGAAPILNYAFQHYLKDHIDLFVGDFNMTGLGHDFRVVNLPLELERTNSSTTITSQGPVLHAEGLDLVYRNPKTLLAVGTTASNTMIGRASVSVVPVPGNDYKKAFELSDHRPVLVILKGL